MHITCTYLVAVCTGDLCIASQRSETIAFTHWTRCHADSSGWTALACKRLGICTSVKPSANREPRHDTGFGLAPPGGSGGWGGGRQ